MTYLNKFLIISGVTFICIAAFVALVLNHDTTIALSEKKVLQTQEIIDKSERLLYLTEGMLSSQRAFLLTRKRAYLNEYESKKDIAYNNLEALKELVAGDSVQLDRLEKERKYILGFADKLDERIANMSSGAENSDSIGGFSAIQSLQDNIERINTDFRRKEYRDLNRFITRIERQKNRYYTHILYGSMGFALVLLILNAFLLRSRSRRTTAEQSLQETKERLTLAIEGTSDGIFDWDLKTGSVFYSRQFFEMIGYDGQDFEGSIADMKAYVHPDDRQEVESYIESILHGELSEYSLTFRMLHKSGRHVWIFARAKVLYGDDGTVRRIVGAHTDITYQKHYEQTLKEQKKKAEEANRAKSKFLAHMSHEIRTPLTSINGVAEIFERKKDQFDARYQTLIKTLKSSSTALRELIRDVLDFSKIESGEIKLSNEFFPIPELFEEVVGVTAIRAAEKNLEFHADYTAFENKKTYGDKTRIRQILINLITNAIKFTDEGHVRIKATRESDNDYSLMRVDVEDTGIGIAEKDHEAIFEHFRQGDSSDSRKHGGTGLGLPISLRLARMMGGDILVDSQEGQGATFTFLLPLRRDGVSESQSGLPQKQHAKISGKIREKTKQDIKDENRVLIAEDYEGNIVILSYILDELGLKYDIAHDGQEAFDLWKQHHYDAILMDIQMPGMDGFSATEKIRSFEVDKNLQRTPVIGMTAHALVGDKDKCIAAGMDAYLPKPIDESDFKTVLLKHLD